MSNKNENRETPNCGASSADPCSASEMYGTSLLARLTFVFYSVRSPIAPSPEHPSRSRMGDDVASPAPLERRRRNGRTDPTNPDADLDQRLAALARAHGPLQRVLAALAERLVETRGWEALAYARLRDYADRAFRGDGDPLPLYDLAHVDGALRDLPGVERVLVTGRRDRCCARCCAWSARATTRPS